MKGRILGPVGSGGSAPSNNGFITTGGDPWSLTRILGGHRMLTEDLSWQDDAVCPTVDPALFFFELGSNVHNIDRAKSICGFCPVQGDCLSYAIRHDARGGVWGGLTETERQPWKDAYTDAGGVIVPFDPPSEYLGWVDWRDEVLT